MENAMERNIKNGCIYEFMGIVISGNPRSPNEVPMEVI